MHQNNCGLSKLAKAYSSSFSYKKLLYVLIKEREQWTKPDTSHDVYKKWHIKWKKRNDIIFLYSFHYINNTLHTQFQSTPHTIIVTEIVVSKIFVYKNQWFPTWVSVRQNQRRSVKVLPYKVKYTSVLLYLTSEST